MVAPRSRRSSSITRASFEPVRGAEGPTGAGSIASASGAFRTRDRNGAVGFVGALEQAAVVIPMLTLRVFGHGDRLRGIGGRLRAQAHGRWGENRGAAQRPAAVHDRDRRIR